MQVLGSDENLLGSIKHSQLPDMGSIQIVDSFWMCYLEELRAELTIKEEKEASTAGYEVDEVQELRMRSK